MRFLNLLYLFFLFALSLLASSPHAAHAQSGFNIDFGIYWGVPEPDAGGAANQPGVWNEAVLGSTMLVDTAGLVTSTIVNVIADTQGSAGGGSDNMIRDNFYSRGGNGWSVDFTGLTNGLYIVYVYAPTNTAVSSGDFVLNGVAFPSIPGDPSGAFIEGVSYLKTTVNVDAGTISLAGSDESFSGLAGMQLVPVPEPGFLLLAAWGIAFLAHLERDRSRMMR